MVASADRTLHREVARIIRNDAFVEPTQGFGMKLARLGGGLIAVSFEWEEEELAAIADVVPPAVLAAFYGDAIAVTAYEPIVSQSVEPDGTVVLSVRGSPSRLDGASVESVLHEMAHAVEIDVARVGRLGWGLGIGGREMRPGTCLDVRRELRVGAIQAHLARHFNLSIDVVEALRRTIPNLAGFASFTERYGDWQAVLAEYCADERRFGMDFFWVEWSRRNALLDRQRRRHLRPRVPRPRRK